jgi:hypothetical protein
MPAQSGRHGFLDTVSIELMNILLQNRQQYFKGCHMSANKGLLRVLQKRDWRACNEQSKERKGSTI